MKMQYKIYKFTCLISGKSYIGYTNKATANERLTEHFQASKRGSKFAFHCAIRKHGIGAWVTEILKAFESEDEARESERELIASHGTLTPGGYNMTSGGDGFRGLSRSDEHREAICQSLLGKEKPLDLRMKIARTLAAQPGRKHSDESRAAIAKAQSGSSHWTLRRPGANKGEPKTYLITTEKGEQFTVTGLAKFCRENGILNGGLAKTVYSKQIRFYRGFSAKLIEA